LVVEIRNGKAITTQPIPAHNQRVQRSCHDSASPAHSISSSSPQAISPMRSMGSGTPISSDCVTSQLPRPMSTKCAQRLAPCSAFNCRSWRARKRSTSSPMSAASSTHDGGWMPLRRYQAAGSDLRLSTIAGNSSASRCCGSQPSTSRARETSSA